MGGPVDAEDENGSVDGVMVGGAAWLSKGTAVRFRASSSELGLLPFPSLLRRTIVSIQVSAFSSAKRRLVEERSGHARLLPLSVGPSQQVMAKESSPALIHGGTQSND
jgi:hypothetical protein